MIRENQKYLNNVQVFLDLFFILVSYGLAHYIRFNVLDSGQLSLGYVELVYTLFAMLPVYCILYNMFDLYTPKRTKPFHREATHIIYANIIASIVLMTGLFFFKMENFSRLSLFIFLLLNVLFTISSRLIIRTVLRKYRRLGYNLKHCLLVGTTPATSRFIDKVHQHPHWGYNLVGVLGQSTTSKLFNSTPILGKLSMLETILEKKYIDMVIIGISGEDLDELGKLLQICEKAGVKTQIIPYYYAYIPAKPYMDDLEGLPVIDIRHVPLDNLFKSFSKRAFDIAFALFAIIITSPFLLFAAVVTKVTSPGPILFKQERVGLNRKTFYMYKFRSMRVQVDEEEKKQWTTKNDPRKTKWGSFMRRTSIDELPQFFNVLKGDMSIVGPRPERPFFVDQFKETIPRYMIKHQVRPGITGWAQINGFRGDTSIKGRIECDLYYIENWNFSFDLKIILLTVFKGFMNKNAY